MKTALCLSGHMRTFQRTIDDWQRFLLAKQEDFAIETDVFIHTWETCGWRNQDQYAKNKYWIPESSDVIDPNRIRALFHPKTLVVEPHADKEALFLAQAEPLYQLYEKYKVRIGADLSRPYALMPSKAHVSQYYKKWACNELKKEYEHTHEFVYDVVITSRPDVSIGQLPVTCFTELDTVVWSSAVADGGNLEDTKLADFVFISNSPNADYLTSIYPMLKEKTIRYEQEDRIAELCEPDRMWYAHIIDGGLVSKKAMFHASIAKVPPPPEELPRRTGWPMF